MIVNLKFINYFNNKKILSKYSLQYIFRIFLFVERPYRFFFNILFVTNCQTDTLTHVQLKSIVRNLQNILNIKKRKKCK